MADPLGPAELAAAPRRPLPRPEALGRRSRSTGVAVNHGPACFAKASQEKRPRRVDAPCPIGRAVHETVARVWRAGTAGRAVDWVACTGAALETVHTLVRDDGDRFELGKAFTSLAEGKPLERDTTLRALAFVPDEGHDGRQIIGVEGWVDVERVFPFPFVGRYDILTGPAHRPPPA